MSLHLYLLLFLFLAHSINSMKSSKIPLITQRLNELKQKLEEPDEEIRAVEVLQSLKNPDQIKKLSSDPLISGPSQSKQECVKVLHQYYTSQKLKNLIEATASDAIDLSVDDFLEKLEEEMPKSEPKIKMTYQELRALFPEVGLDKNEKFSIRK